MEVVMRVIRYLKGTPYKGFLFQNNGHLEVEAFTDADWAQSNVDRDQTLGTLLL